MGAPDETNILDTTAAGPKIIRGGIMRMGGYVAGSGLAVVSAAVLTRHLGPADFGRYATVFALITVVTGLADAGTANIGVREHSLRRDETGWRFLEHLLGIRLTIAAIGVIGAIGFTLLVGYESAMVLGTAAAGVGLLLTVVYGTLAIPLQTSLRLGWVTNLDLLRQAATVVGLIGLVAAGAGIVPLLAVPIPVGIVLVAATGTLVGRRLGMRPTVDREEWARILRLTLPFAAASVAGVLYAHVSVVGLSLAATERETGLFAAAFRVYFVLATIPALIVSTAFPLLARAARDDRERLAYAVRRLFETCLVLGTGMAIVTAVGAPVAIDIVAGPAYSDAVDALRVLSGALFGTFIIALGGFALLSLERYRPLLWANLVGLLLSGGLTIGLAPALGEMAGAIAVTAGDLTLAALYVAALRRGSDGIRFGAAAVAKTAAAAALACATLLIGLGPAVVQAIVAGTVFAVAALALRAVPREFLDALPRRSS
jgi:O-antigen/teichoic acid export membrane protein